LTIESKRVWLIVGLGNPGAEYAATRHNIGFMAVDKLANTLRAPNFSNKFQAEIASVDLAGEASRPSEPSAAEGARSTRQNADVRSNQKLLLLKPQTFMNHSGRSVQAAMAFYKIPPSQLIVLHDELDLPPGKIRIKKGGGANGHNGLRDIDACVGQDYWRIRLGIGHPGTKEQVHGYVLARFGADDRVEVDKINEALAAHFALFWNHSPEALATKIAQTLNPPRIKKTATEADAQGKASDDK
jgi:PTH1 family peptidyl-tRNA hydrolase